MQKHVTIVGIFNIVYRSLVFFGAVVLAGVAIFFDWVMGILLRIRALDLDEVPVEVFDIIPAILTVIAVLVAVVSIAGIVGGAAVLKKKEWGRVLLLIVSFLNLMRIPFGTCLGAYTIWVLFNDETIRIFQPTSVAPPAKP